MGDVQCVLAVAVAPSACSGWGAAADECVRGASCRPQPRPRNHHPAAVSPHLVACTWARHATPQSHHPGPASLSLLAESETPAALQLCTISSRRVTIFAHGASQRRPLHTHTPRAPSPVPRHLLALLGLLFGVELGRAGHALHPQRPGPGGAAAHCCCSRVRSKKHHQQTTTHTHQNANTESRW